MPYIGNKATSNFTSMSKQDLTGATGGTLTLNTSVASASEIALYINNVRQEPTTSYTVSGTTVTLQGYTVAGTDDIYVIYLGKAIQTTVPPDGSITSSKLSSETMIFNNHVLPSADDTYDLGSSSKQWRDIYTGDINLNNTKTRNNEVDGTRGSWTIQEGSNDLFLINRLTNKKYKFKLQEIE